MKLNFCFFSFINFYRVFFIPKHVKLMVTEVIKKQRKKKKQKEMMPFFMPGYVVTLLHYYIILQHTCHIHTGITDDIFA